jgi:hypothetical protein
MKLTKIYPSVCACVQDAKFDYLQINSKIVNFDYVLLLKSRLTVRIDALLLYIYIYASGLVLSHAWTTINNNYI